MKLFRYILCLSLAVTIFQKSAFCQGNVDNIFCLGNGEMAAYGTGADILQLFGPPYSSPSLAKLTLADSSLEVSSRRERYTAIWSHTLSRAGATAAVVTDFVDATQPVFVRRISATTPVSFSLALPASCRVITGELSDSALGLSGDLLVESPAGTPFYNDYPMPQRQYLEIAARGSVQLIREAPGHYTVRCGPGTGYLYFAGGPRYPDCITHARGALTLSYDSLLRSTRSWWQRFSTRRHPFQKTLPPDLPMRDKLLETIDAVSVALKTQQGVEGGVLAGHNYHLAYVRDEYGVSRCLLSLGYYREARDILAYYWKIWQRRGVLHTAQGIGVDAFHVHENDQVELTSYLIIQAFDYLGRTRDTQFIRRIFPMLAWAWNTSKTKLIRHMLPFDGDETYIAGGILPRSCIIDGSAETTLLFITSGRLLLPWVRENGLWDSATLAGNRQLLQETALHYRENFYSGGHFYCNNPSRSVGATLPMFRHGVCEGRFPGCEFFGWTQKNAFNRYLCPVCFAKEEGRQLPAAPPRRYEIHSVSLMPLYVGFSGFSRTEIGAMVDRIATVYRRTGMLPSRPDGHTTVGYDYGLLLYNLSLLKDTAATAVYEKMLGLRDATGTWSEYYQDGKAMGTRYRPWESGINLEAALLYARSYGSLH
jgi:hypothetical protein